MMSCGVGCCQGTVHGLDDRMQRKCMAEIYMTTSDAFGRGMQVDEKSKLEEEKNDSTARFAEMRCEARAWGTDGCRHYGRRR